MRKNNPKHTNVAASLQNENGSTLVVTLIVLILVTFMGIAGVNTAVTDLQITRNYRIHKENLALADAAVNHAAVWVDDNLGSDVLSSVMADLVENKDGFYDVVDLWDSDSKYFKESDWNRNLSPIWNQIDVDAVVADWDTLEIDGIPITRASFSSDEPDTEYVAFVCIYSTDEDLPGEAVVIARSRKNGGNVIIEAGLGNR